MEFPSAQMLSDHIKGGHTTKPDGWEKPKRIKLSDIPKDSLPVEVVVPTNNAPIVSIKPIELEYKFSGDCSDCKNPIDTIIVGITLSQQTAVAYCSHCKKQFKQVSVIPITQQLKGKFLFDESK